MHIKVLGSEPLTSRSDTHFALVLSTFCADDAGVAPSRESPEDEEEVSSFTTPSPDVHLVASQKAATALLRLGGRGIRHIRSRDLGRKSSSALGINGLRSNDGG